MIHGGVFTDVKDGRLYAFVKSSDIPRILSVSGADIGFVGSDKLDEAQLGGKWQGIASKPIANANCSLVAAGRSDSRILQTQDRIATSYPNLARAWVNNWFNCVPNSVKVSFCPMGSVEAYVDLEMADVIVDIRESGESLRANNLLFYTEIKPITTNMAWLDATKPKDLELDVNNLYRSLAAIEGRKVPIGTYAEERWKLSKTLTQLLFDDPNLLVKKIGSESAEFIQEIVKRNPNFAVSEAQDVMYALAVALSSLNRSLIQALNML